MKATSSKKYLWRECLASSSEENTVVYCESSTQYQIVTREKLEPVAGGSFWKCTKRVDINLTTLQIVISTLSRKGGWKFRNETYSLTTYNKSLVPLLVNIVGKEEVAKFAIKYGFPSHWDRCKFAWRGETLKEVLIKANLPHSRNVIKSLGESITKWHDPLDTVAALFGVSYGISYDNLLPNLSIFSFVWSVTRDINVLVCCIEKRRRMDVEIPRSVKLHKRMFRKFYMSLDSNQKRNFNAHLHREIYYLPDILQMMDEYEIDINAIKVPEKSLSGIHNAVTQIRNVFVDEELKFYHEIEFKTVPYLDGVEVPFTDLRLEYPKNRETLEQYGRNHHNCVGSYFDKVKEGKSIILGVYKKDKHIYTAEIDVYRRRLIQLQGSCNTNAKNVDRVAISSYISSVCNKNMLLPEYVRLPNMVRGSL